MKVVHYTGGAHIRQFSSQDLDGMGIKLSEGFSVDSRVDRNAIVSNRTAAALVKLGEFTVVGTETDNEDDAVFEQENIDRQRALAASEAETTPTEINMAPEDSEAAVARSQGDIGAVPSASGRTVPTTPAAKRGGTTRTQ